MRAKRLWIGGAVFLLLVAVLLIFRLEVGYIVSGLFLGTDNPYRVAGAVEVDDHGQMRKSVVFNGANRSRSTPGTPAATPRWFAPARTTTSSSATSPSLSS
jgi:hypothetical protein